MIALLQPIPMA
ncbi:hypothetical protein D043_3116A, partial [Vibrio parahaemolyticus EKP-021]